MPLMEQILPTNIGWNAQAKTVNSSDLAFRLGQASLHTSLTLWHRLPMLAVTGKARDVPELNRMVSEKAAAMVDGAFAAQKEMLRLAGKAMTGALSFQDVADMPASVASAGLRPAFRTVKANSRRLSRRS